MPDPLYEAIEKAIDGELDGDIFERCAVDLLRDRYYPTLRAVEGGNDAGQDGRGALPGGEPFFLVSTVSDDARANLQRNIRSYLDAGGDRRAAVFATPRKVSGRRQIELRSSILQEFGVQLAEIHDRADFVDLLYRNSTWRRELLGVPGLARALTRVPRTRRPMPEVRLIGRDADITQLRLIDTDLVLVGKPGIGKTFLLQQLMAEDWGLFDDSWAVADLEDSIRDLRPARVVLDDAHLDPERLAVLRQLRAQMEVDFAIVAVTWPGQQEQVAAALPGSKEHELEELERDQILQVIGEVGVVEPAELQAHLVDQALGRAGLAVTLAHACVSGRAGEVARGDVLLTDVVGWFARSLGSEARHVLGVLALTGEGGATLSQVSHVLALSLPRVSDLVRGLASGGTIDEVRWQGVSARLAVLPESLRYALVRDVFFGGPGSIDVTAVLGALDRPGDALLPLIGAAHRGARVDRALLRSVLDPHSERAVVAYALMGQNEAREAFDLWPQHAAALARAAYDQGIGEERALGVLMELAIGDNRSERSYPDHPLRPVEDRLHRPEATIEARRAAVDIADRWLQEGRDPTVGLRVMMHALHPGTRTVSTDPGLGTTVTIREGVLAASGTEELGDLWDQALDVLDREHPAEIGVVLDGLHAWVYPDALALGRGPDQTARVVLKTVATRVLGRLRTIFRERPGILSRLRNYAETGRLAVQIEVPADFDALFPRGWDGQEAAGGHEGWYRRSEQRVRDLAETLAPLSPEAQADRLAALERDGAQARVSWPRFTPTLAQFLAEMSDCPEALLDGLHQAGTSFDLLLPVLDRIVDQHRPDWEARLEALIGDEATVGIATQVALTRPVGVRLKSMAVERMDGRFGNMIEVLVARGQTDAETLGMLLGAPDAHVARATAIALAHGNSPVGLSALPEGALARWRRVIVENPADEYWYSVILKRDPSLFADWLRGWFRRLRDGSGDHEFLPHTLQESIGSLPVEIRRELIAAIPAEVHSVFVQDVVTGLVAEDVEVARTLLGRDDLANLHWTVLRAGPNEAWFERATMAMELGWEPARIVGYTTFADSAWSGEESLHWQQKIDAFRALHQDGDPPDTPRERLVRAGVERFEQLRVAADSRERRERIFGIGQ